MFGVESGGGRMRDRASFHAPGHPPILVHMSKPAVRHPLISVEEYLRLEETSPVRHEYVAGVIHALAGASKRHNQIAGNIYARLRVATRGSNCRVYIGDAKVRADDDVYYYPDVVVRCGSDDPDPYVVSDPCLVVEVASPSTETTDRREKAAAYKRLPSMQAYVIVYQDRRRVERHYRDPDGTWWHADVAGEGGVPLPCPEVRLTLDQIYEDVDPA
jgi:Uma2 family endonuclease